LESGGTESGTIRKIVWTGALRIWQANPKNFLIGTGPETFAQAYYQYRPLEHNQTSEWELLYNKAHNEFLNYLVTTGILGLGSYIVLLISMARVFQISNFKFQIGSISVSLSFYLFISAILSIPKLSPTGHIIKHSLNKPMEISSK